MTTLIHQLRPSGMLKPPATPQCEATRINRYANDRKGPLTAICKLQSSFIIDGQHFCKKHAGDYALRVLLKLAGQPSDIQV